MDAGTRIPIKSWLASIDEREALRALWWVIGIGTLVRVLIAFDTYGYGFDMDSLVMLRHQLDADPLHVYGAMNTPLHLESFHMQYRWPYPPAFFPWAWVSGQAGALGLPFDGVVQLPAIAADAGLALLSFDFLRRRGHRAGRCFLGGALVAIAPPLLLTSGYRGQIDSVAFLPAVGAVYLWDRGDIWERRGELARPLTVGLVIGVGAAVKIVPIILLAAFFPWVVRRPRAALALIVPALAVPLLLLAPFAVADPTGVGRSIGYAGSPGDSGLSMLAQPGLVYARAANDLGSVSLNDATRFFYLHGGELALFALGAISLFLLVTRPEPVLGALLLIVGLYVFGPNDCIQYFSWCIPFLVMAGMLRVAAAVSIWMIVPSAIAYWWHSPALVPLYICTMGVLYLGWVALATALVNRIRFGSARRAGPPVAPAVPTLAAVAPR